MPFNPIPKKEQKQIKKTQFMDVKEGTHQVRILDDSYHSQYLHYINNAYVSCLGEDCPQCALNNRIFIENSKNFRTIDGYRSRQLRHAVNVFDKTLVKICPNCGAEIKRSGNTPAITCPSCNTLLSTVGESPLNKVKLLVKGNNLFDDLYILQETIKDSSGNKLGLTNFDVILVVTGSGRDTKIQAIPNTASMEKLEVPEEEKFDRESAFFKISEEEMVSLMNGVSMRDILVARNATLSDVNEEVTTEIKDRVDNLFSN